MFKVGSYFYGTRFSKMMEEKYSQNERIKKFALIVCGLTFVSVVLSLLTYWVYVQWNKVEPKKGKLAIYNLKMWKNILSSWVIIRINHLSDCTTKDFQKCSILFGTISNGNELNNCSWYENKETVWCQTIYSDNEKLTKYGYCQANCSSNGNKRKTLCS